MISAWPRNSQMLSAVDRFLGMSSKGVKQRLLFTRTIFGPLHKDFYITNWLIEEGFLTLKEKPDGIRSAFFRHPWGRRLGCWLDRVGEKTIGSLLPRKLTKRFLRQVFPGYHGMLPWIDWSKTKAYFPTIGDQSIHINLRGRDPMGIVEQGSPEEVKSLIEELEPWVKSGGSREFIRGKRFTRRVPANSPDMVIEMRTK
jgi:predicted AlkP superfamily phosphohydrolase/phosphomutase